MNKAECQKKGAFTYLLHEICSVLIKISGAAADPHSQAFIKRFSCHLSPRTRFKDDPEEVIGSHEFVMGTKTPTDEFISLLNTPRKTRRRRGCGLRTRKKISTVEIQYGFKMCSGALQMESGFQMLKKVPVAFKSSQTKAWLLWEVILILLNILLLIISQILILAWFS